MNLFGGTEGGREGGSEGGREDGWVGGWEGGREGSPRAGVQTSCPFQYNMLHKPIGLAWCVTTQYVGEDSGFIGHASCEYKHPVGYVM